MWVIQSWAFVLTLMAIGQIDCNLSITKFTTLQFSRVSKPDLNKEHAQSLRRPFKQSNTVNCALACLHDPRCDIFDFDDLTLLCELLTLVCGVPNSQQRDHIYWDKTVGEC